MTDVRKLGGTLRRRPCTQWAAQAFGLRVESAGGGGGEALGGAGGGARGGGLPRTRFAELEEGTRLGTPVRLEPGEAVALTVTIDLDDHAAGNRSQNCAIGLDLIVTFSEGLASGDGEAPGDDEGSEDGWPGEKTHVDHGRGSVPDHSLEPASGRVTPVFGPANSASQPDPHPSSQHGRERPTAGDTSAPSDERGVLAVTGAPARGMLLGALTALLLGAVLMFTARRHTQGKR